MEKHTNTPSFRKLRGYRAATALHACRLMRLETAFSSWQRDNRSLSALKVLVVRVDGRPIERGFLSLHSRVIVSLEVLQDLVAALACKALQID